MKKVYGCLDSAASSCILLYDFFGNSYYGEPTTNLFTQPTGNDGFAVKPVNTGAALAAAVAHCKPPCKIKLY